MTSMRSRLSETYAATCAASRGARCVLVACALTAMGCTNEEGGWPADRDAAPSSDDAGSIVPAPHSDAAAPIDASEDSANRATACTAPPFVPFDITVDEANDDGSEVALPGAIVGFDTCAGFRLITDAKGLASTSITQNVPISPLISALNHVSVVIAQAPASAAFSARASLFATGSNRLPGYSSTTPLIEVTLAAGGRAPCDGASGVTLRVTGHPEAVVKYMATGWPADSAPTNATSSVGAHAFISGLAAGQTVDVTGTKDSCAVTALSASQTGKLVLVEGAVSTISLRVTDP